MRAGQLAAKAGVNFETLRFYEREGVLPEPRRSSNGYRHYDETHLRALLFVNEAKNLGFGLPEIRGLVGLNADAKSDCLEVAGIARTHLESLQKKMRGLRCIERALKNLVAT